MVHLFTTDIEKWLLSLATLTLETGRWTVAASVYTRAGMGHTIHVGVRAAVWLPLGREMVVYDLHTEVVPHSAAGQAAQRDAIAIVERIEEAANHRDIRFLPCLLDWMPESSKRGGAA
jgi:hypothetical protein